MHCKWLFTLVCNLKKVIEMYVNLQIIMYTYYFYVRQLFYTGPAAKQSIELLLVVLSTKCKLFVMAPITFLLQDDTRPLR